MITGFGQKLREKKSYKLIYQIQISTLQAETIYLDLDMKKTYTRSIYVDRQWFVREFQGFTL